MSDHKLKKYLSESTVVTKNYRHYEFLIDLFTDREYEEIINSIFHSRVCRSIIMFYSLNPDINMLVEPLSLKYENITGSVCQDPDNTDYYEMYINSYKQDYISGVDKNLHSYIQKDDVPIMKAYNTTSLSSGVNFKIYRSNHIIIANLRSSFMRDKYILTINNREVCAFIINGNIILLIPNTLFYSEGKTNIIKEWMYPTYNRKPTKELVESYNAMNYNRYDYTDKSISIKNNKDRFILQCNDTNSSYKTIDFSNPISPLIAFSVAIIKFDKK
jgi:hypothetical protein